MTKALYEGRRTNFGANSERLTDKVIENMKTCFTYALYHNCSLSSSIRPHCFGDHAQCGVWCRYSDDVEGYHHSTLPGHKDLQGDELKLLLTDVLLPFVKNEVARKLAPLGAT